jgi:hypothetical protein
MDYNFFIRSQITILFILMVVMNFGFPVITTAQPYPYSEVITDIIFGDPEKLTERRAGDNWPVTWAENGHLYSAWGDGQGPDHPNGTRVSMGWVRVEGNPPEVKIIDTYSPQKETGSGRSGHKASGMLMIDGVIYMWIRNDNKSGEHSRLWWSTDEAVTWNQANWNFPEFGYTTFINFGQNYEGARDNYVYSVSPDTLDAYVNADDFILMRVPKSEITERSRYEFFSGFDNNGNPSWSYKISERKSVFHHPERCNRSSISYNAALDRFIWWQGVCFSPDGEDTRFNPAPLGIYEAPEPWGPWRTVSYDESFESPGETGCFPTKWMGTVNDSKQIIYMLTSHDDAFTIWPVTLGIELNP